MTVLPRTPHRIGVAADHGGYDLKEYLARLLRKADYDVMDFGNGQPTPDDDYPDYVVPLARAVARGEVDRGVAICGSGVGASVVATKVAGVRACLMHDTFSAHQGVEDEDLNLLCLGAWSSGTHSRGNWSTLFSPHDSVAPNVIVAAWRPWRNWNTRRHTDARQSIEDTRDARAIHLVGLHPTRFNHQWTTATSH